MNVLFYSLSNCCFLALSPPLSITGHHFCKSFNGYFVFVVMMITVVVAVGSGVAG